MKKGKKKPKKQPSEEEALLAAAAKEESGLTPMQAAFVREYVASKNATDAAKRAGYSAKSASQLGYQLLQIPSVRSAIEKKFQQQAVRLDLSADRVLLEIMRIATADLAQAYNENGNLKPIHEMPEEVRRAIVGIETEQEVVPGTDGEDAELIVTKKVKFADKNRALELLAKHLKLLTDKVEHSGKIGLEDLVAGSHDAGPEKD